MNTTSWMSCLAVAVTSALSGCAHATDGKPVYDSASPAPSSHLVKAADLQRLFPSPSEFGALIDSPQLHQDDNYTDAVPLPPGRFISDPACTIAMSPGLDTTYRGSKYQGAYGIDASDDHSRVLEAVAAGFPGAREAQANVDAQLDKLKGCANKDLSAGSDNRPPAHYMLGDITQSNGVAVLVRVQEGGQGYACGRGVAAKDNVVADVMMCNFDPSVVEHQTGALANLVLEKVTK